MTTADGEGKKRVKENSKHQIDQNKMSANKKDSQIKSKELYVTNNNMDEKKHIKEQQSWKQKSIWQKYRHLKSLITVEPILAFYVMPSVLSALATQNLYLEKACRVNLQYEDHVCDALTRRDTANYTLQEDEVQKLVASVAGWKTVLQSFLPCALILFLGGYSDRVGRRKFLMLLPIIGEFLTSVGLIVNTYLFYELPLEVAAVTEAIFPALTGGWFTMFMGVFSYIADVTTEEQRTVRIGVVNLFYSLGVPVGSALSGILVREIGFYGVFALSASLYVLSFLYGYYRVQEVTKAVPEYMKTNNCCEWTRSFFDVRYVKETVLVAFRHGPNERRARVCMLVVVLCVVIGPIYGEMAVMYLFTRYRFNWNEVDFSVFSTYSMCTSLVGTLFSVGVFSHALKLDDAIVGIISCTSKILSAFMYAFAATQWQIYIGPLLEIFNGTSFIAMRSMVSKLVCSDELGKVNSLFAVAEAMMPLVYAPMYTSLYSATIKTFPGGFFLLGAFLTLPAVLIFAWLYFASKKEINSVRRDKEQQEKEKECISGGVGGDGGGAGGAGGADGASKQGIVNSGFEGEESTRHGANNIEADTELGITESIHATSKM